MCVLVEVLVGVSEAKGVLLSLFPCLEVEGESGEGVGWGF